jgi:hypothetical protein
LINQKIIINNKALIKIKKYTEFLAIGKIFFINSSICGNEKIINNNPIMIDSLPSDINLVVKVVSGPKIWSVKCKSVGDGLSLFVGKYCKLSLKYF